MNENDFPPGFKPAPGQFDIPEDVAKVHLIGSVIVAWAYVEFLLDVVLFSLEVTARKSGDRVPLRFPKEFKRRIRMAKDIARNELGYAANDDLIALLNDSLDLRAQRDAIAHSVWIPPKEGTDMDTLLSMRLDEWFNFRRTAQSNEKLARLLGRIGALTGKVEAYIDTARAHSRARKAGMTYAEYMASHTLRTKPS